jgi:hypothetical protein
MSGFTEVMSLLSPLIAVATLGLGLIRFRQIEKRQAKLLEFQARESGARAEHTLNVTVDVSVIECSIAEKKIWIVETNVAVENSGRDTVCIPAVYVSARALMDPTRLGSDGAGFYHSDFESLPECGDLSIPQNVAALPSSIIQVAPGEVEHCVRWDWLGQSFVERYPVLVVNVEVFGASCQLLGHWTKGGEGEGGLRRPWLNYMRDKANANDTFHKTILFTRASPALEFEHGPGKLDKVWEERALERRRRVLLGPTSPGTKNKVDVTHSKAFGDLLDSVVQWSRQKTVVLSTEIKKAADAVVPPPSLRSASAVAPGQPNAGAACVSSPTITPDPPTNA